MIWSMFMRHDALIIGGCSATTPGQIRHVVENAASLKPRAILEGAVAPRLSGLEPFELAS